jgi:hypothetical protein
VAPGGCFAPGRTGRLTVGRNMRLDSTRLVHACATTNTNPKSEGTVRGGVLYSVRLEFMRQGIAD